MIIYNGSETRCLIPVSFDGVPNVILRPVGIKKVIFNNPATIVYWNDGTKTVVKCQEGDIYDEQTGLLMCIAKKMFGNGNRFNDILRKWVPEEEEIDLCKHCIPLEPPVISVTITDLPLPSTLPIDIFRNALTGGKADA